LRNGSQGITKNPLPNFLLIKTHCGCLMIWLVNWTGVTINITQKSLADLKGKIKFADGYDYKAMRRGF